MNILETIVARKRKEVEARKKEKDLRTLEKEICFSHAVRSLKDALLDPARTGIIAEFKRRSPSKGVINDSSTAASVTEQYAAHGASGISVLTDEEFFGGSLDDLLSARKNDLPLLRKDFMIDAYQLTEAKAYGADVILLIAACLSPKELRRLAEAAHDLGLEVLLELHDESELGHVCDAVDMVGINNRNLKTFQVDLEHSVRLAEKIGNGFIKVAESGIDNVKNIQYLKQFGFRGFLIGEHFMKQKDPGTAFRNFVHELLSPEKR
jgi:indole-3-glycerol phosphate synthase